MDKPAGRQSVDSVISILRNLEEGRETSPRDQTVVPNPYKTPLPAPVYVLSELNVPSVTRVDGARGRAYSLFSTDSDSTVTGTKKAMDKVSKLLSLLLGEDMVLEDDFDETLLANKVLDRLKWKSAASVEKENADPSAPSSNGKVHERKNSSNNLGNHGGKGFPKAIKRKTISVKNVKAKPAVAATMKQQQQQTKVGSKQTQQQKQNQRESEPAKFTRRCCPRSNDNCGHSAGPSPRNLSAPKSSFASWKVDTPTSRSSVVSAPACSDDASSIAAPTPMTLVETAGASKPVSFSQPFGAEDATAEVPVRDSDPIPTPLTPLPHVSVDAQPTPLDPPTSVVAREIDAAATREDAIPGVDVVKTFHSQRRALRFLVNELREALTANYGPLDAHCARTIQAIDKIVTLMQKSKYVPPGNVRKGVRVVDDDEDELSTASFASIDVDLALQPLRDENAQLRGRIRELARELRDLRLDGQVMIKLFDDVVGTTDGASLQTKAMAVKEKASRDGEEIASLKSEVGRLQSSLTSLSNERQDLLRLLGAKEGDADRIRVEALEEASRLRRDVDRYENDFARSAALLREKEERVRVLDVNVNDKDEEIKRLKDLVGSLQRSMASLVHELQEAGPTNLTPPPPVTPPLPVTLTTSTTESRHVVGPGGDGPTAWTRSRLPMPDDPATSNGAASPANVERIAGLASSETMTQTEGTVAPSTGVRTIPKTVSESLREFLEGNETLSRTVTSPSDSPPTTTPALMASEEPQRRDDDTTATQQSPPPPPPPPPPDDSSASRFSVSAYLQKYGLQVARDNAGSNVDRRRTSSSNSHETTTTTKNNNFETRWRESSGATTFAQSTPASTPKKRLIPTFASLPDPIAGGVAVEAESFSRTFLPLSNDDSTLTGISEISSISSVISLVNDEDRTNDGGSSCVSSLASRDELEFKAGLEELDASIQRLRQSLKRK